MAFMFVSCIPLKNVTVSSLLHTDLMLLVSSRNASVTASALQSKRRITQKWRYKGSPNGEARQWSNPEKAVQTDKQIQQGTGKNQKWAGGHMSGSSGDCRANEKWEQV